MARSGWFNDNSNRCFPFMRRTTGEPIVGPLTVRNLPNDIVVDAGFVVGVHSRFDAGHKVRLAAIRRISDTFFFDFVCNAPELLDVPITFTRHIGDPQYLTETTDTDMVGISESSSLSASESQLCTEPLWSGYMVSGNIESLALLLPDSGEIRGTENDAIVEPALVRSAVGSYVTSFNVANNDRTRVTSPEDCDAVVWPYPTDTIFINQKCLTGELVIKPGYNAVIRQNDQDNSITLIAALGEGEGIPCGEVPLSQNEVPPAGSNLLTGGPQCNEVLRSINGKGGRIFDILTGDGVTVTAVPGENKLIIDVNMSGLSLCFSRVSTVSESV